MLVEAQNDLVIRGFVADQVEVPLVEFLIIFSMATETLHELF